MTVSAFFDTHAAVPAGRYEHERKRAMELVESTGFGTFAQSCRYFFVTVVKKVSRPISPAHALEWIGPWAVFPARPLTIN